MQGLDAQGITDYLDHLRHMFLEAEAGAEPMTIPEGPLGGEDASTASQASLLAHASVRQPLVFVRDQQ